MPFVLPPDILSEKIAFVLAYGRLSVLEACSILRNSVHRAEAPSERVSVFEIDPMLPESIAELAGSHKIATVTAEVRDSTRDISDLVDNLVPNLDEKSRIALSGYEIDEDDYENLVRSLLDGVRASGLRKVRLLRPRNNELQGEEVLARQAVDVIAFPYHGGFGLGPTLWVPDSASMKRRGTQKPTPHPDISLSPRLARVLVNLAGLRDGQTLLDPFCGSGTILAEALYKSYRCLGLDSSASRVQDARENLGWLLGGLGGGERYDVRKGDARELFRLLRGSKVGAIVTEPLLLPRLDARPRTTTASGMIDSAAEVYSDSLASMADSVVPGGRIVIVVPIIQTMDGEEVTMTLDGKKLGLRLYQPGPVGFEYPVRLSFESTRWVRRGVYVFESPS